MKLIYALAFTAVFATSANAQKYVPQIKEGTVLSYDARSRALGQSLPLTLTVKSYTDNLLMQWFLAGFGSGTFQISGKAVENGTRIGFKQPDPDDVTKLKDDETLNTISKSTFKDLVTNKSFLLNGQTFNVTTDTTTFIINQKPADVFYAVNTTGKTKLWILNNPLFPLICKLIGGPQGIDLTLTAVKE